MGKREGSFNPEDGNITQSGMNISSDTDNDSILQSTSTANAILNILQKISISPPQSPNPFSSIISNSSKSTLHHLHSLPKSLIPKRRLSSSSSFDDYNSTPRSNDKSNKKQLVYLRGHKLQTVRSLPSPLSRSHLIKRLNTFSVLNWTISSPKLSPLVCATQGWKCHPVRKNELHCTSCHSGIIVKLAESPENKSHYNSGFNTHHYNYNDNTILNNSDEYEFQFQFQFLDDEYEDDDSHVYDTLVNSYVSRLSTDHYTTCTFLPLLPLSPNDQNYYITAKDIPREILKFENRLDTLKKNKDRLIGRNFNCQFLTKDEIKFLLEYLKQNSKDDIDIDIDDDNINMNLSINPSLDVILPGLLGWELKMQQFHNEKFLLLKCECCTRRILLSTVNTENVQDVQELKSCPHKAEIPAREEPTEFDETILPKQQELEYDEEDEYIDLEKEHDSWCCMTQGWRIALEGLRSCTDIYLNRVPGCSNNNGNIITKDLFNTTMNNLRGL